MFTRVHLGKDKKDKTIQCLLEASERNSDPSRSLQEIGLARDYLKDSHWRRMW